MDKQGHFFSVQRKEDIATWLKQMPELNILADLQIEFLLGEDDTLVPEHWEKIAKNIKAKAGLADGFVIVARPEQIIQTGVALSFLLQNFSKTIILTGAAISGTDYNYHKSLIKELRDKHGGTGLKSNLINAIQVANQVLPGPAIMFGTRLIPALKAISTTGDLTNMFASLDNNYWGRVDFGISLKSGLQYSKQRMLSYDRISAKVLLLEDILGIPWSLEKTDLAKYQAIVVRLGGDYGLEKSKQSLLEKSGRPAVLYYPHFTLVSGVLNILSDCSWETAVLKTMWAVANQTRLPSFEKIIRQNVVGEFNER